MGIIIHNGVLYGTQPDISGKVDKVTGKDLSTNDYTDEEKTKLAGITLPLPIVNGGTGSTTAMDAIFSLTFLGKNPTGGSNNDTREFWQSRGNGYAYITLNNQLNGQPSQHCFLINLVYSVDQYNEVHQELWVQPNGEHYCRGANGTVTNMPKWQSVAKAAFDTLPCLVLNCGALSSLPTTIDNAAITADMAVIKADLSNPSAQAVNDWQAVCVDGAVTISGTISGTTALTLYLMKSRT